MCKSLPQLDYNEGLLLLNTSKTYANQPTSRSSCVEGTITFAKLSHSEPIVECLLPQHNCSTARPIKVKFFLLLLLEKDPLLNIEKKWKRTILGLFKRFELIFF